MATFLQLVNDVERESGTIYQGQRLQTVVGAPGRQEKMVEWVAEAWRLIQLARADWPWMTAEFDKPLIASQARYTPANLTLTNVARWRHAARAGYDPYTIYDPARGVAEEQPLRLIGYEEWKTRWARGAHQPMQPIEVAISPDGQLCFGPTPDKAYTVRGEYRRTVQILAADADVPLMPSDHHGLIVWRAIMLMGDHDEAAAAVQTGMAKFTTGLRALVDDSFEAVTL